MFQKIFSSRDSILLLAGGTPRRTTERLSSSLSWSVTRAWAASPPTLCPSSRAGPSSTTLLAYSPPPSTSRDTWLSVLLILGYQCWVYGFFGPPGPGSGSISQKYGSGSFWSSFYHKAKIVRKTSFELFIFEKWCKCTFRKLFFKISFVGGLNVNDENSRIRIQIRIRTKMSWIRNTASRTIQCCGSVTSKFFCLLVIAYSTFYQ